MDDLYRSLHGRTLQPKLGLSVKAKSHRKQFDKKKKPKQISLPQGKQIEFTFLSTPSLVPTMRTLYDDEVT